MSAVKRKLKTLSLAEKLEVLEAVKRCQKKKDVAEQFGLPMSTLSTIIKNESDILRKIQNGQSLACKRRRIAKYPGLEECLLEWFEQCRNQNISVSGKLLQEKAQIFSKSLGLFNFRSSNGWLEKFKRRQKLVFKKVCGESASVKVQKTDTNDSDDIKDVNITCAPWVSTKEARTALNTLRNFIEQTSNSEEEFSALYRLDNAIYREQANYLKKKNN